MSIAAQNIIIAIIFAVAASYLVRAGWRTMIGRKAGNCCGTKKCARMEDMQRRLEMAGKGRRVRG